MTAKKAKFNCPECGQKFESAKGLGGHRYRSHGIVGMGRSSVAARAKKEAEPAAVTTLPPAVPLVEVLEFKCPECGEVFEKSHLLGLHRRKHGVMGSSPASIDAQRKRIVYLSSYKRDKNNLLICPECNKSLPEVGITMHRKMAHGVSAEEQLKVVSSAPSAVSVLDKIDTSIEGPQRCPECDFVAANVRGLRVHIGFKHRLSQTPVAIERRQYRLERKSTIEQPTQAITIAETNGNLGHAEEAHPAPSGYAIPDQTLALALGRFQGLCQSFAVEFDLPPRMFAARLAELIYHAQVR